MWIITSWIVRNIEESIYFGNKVSRIDLYFPEIKAKLKCTLLVRREWDKCILFEREML